MIRGTVAWVDLRDATPPEFGKFRPALLISNTEINRQLPTVAVIPISTRPGEIWPLRLGLPKLERMKKGYLVIPGIRQVNKIRLGKVLGLLTDEYLASVDNALSAYLGE